MHHKKKEKRKKYNFFFLRAKPCGPTLTNIYVFYFIYRSDVTSAFKVGSYDAYFWYWRVSLPQVITFDPEGVRA